MTGTTQRADPNVVAYSAEDSPRGFLHHALRAFGLPSLLRRHRGLVRHFVSRDLKVRFEGSALGPLWVLLHPLFLFAVYFVVFGSVLGRLDDKEPIPFALYLFSGLVCFQMIVQSTNAALNSILGNANIVKKVKFPCEVLPIVPVLVETVVFFVGAAVVVLVGVITGALQPTWSMLALPWFLVVLVTFASGLALMLANLQVFWRDVGHFYAIFGTAWFLLSPNFWPPKLVLDKAPWAATVMTWNPAYHILLAERHVLGLARVEDGFSDSVMYDLTIASVWALGFLFLGYGTFMANKHKYADLV